MKTQRVKNPKFQGAERKIRDPEPLRYDSSNSEPYTVLCDGKEITSIDGYQTVNFANKIIQAGVNIERTEGPGRFRVRLFFPSATLANKLLNDIMLHNQLNITSRISKMLIHPIGVIYGILIGIPTHEILTNIESSLPAIEVRRLKKRVTAETGYSILVDTKLIEITLEA